MWWLLRSRTREGEEWAMRQYDKLQSRLSDENEQASQRTMKLMQTLTADLALLKQGRAFFGARPRRIVSVQKMTTKQVYWTLIVSTTRYHQRKPMSVMTQGTSSERVGCVRSLILTKDE